MNGSAPVIAPEDLLASAEELGALPTTVARLAAVVSDPEHDIRDVVEVVSLDQALTAAVLRRVNSAALGARLQIKTVRDAAMFLGGGALLSLAFATRVSRRLRQPIPAYGLAEGQLWRQSVAASFAAEVVRSRAAVEVPTEAPTAALLHDFGKVVLAQHFGPRVLTMLAQAAAAEDLGLLAAETRIFGINHAEIGGLVAQAWKLPHTIVDAIVHHHHVGPHPSSASAAVGLAHAMVPDVLGADAADGTDGIDAADDPDGDGPTDGAVGPLGALPCVPLGHPAETHVEVLAQLGFRPDDYPALVEAARQRYEDLADRYRAD